MFHVKILFLSVLRCGGKMNDIEIESIQTADGIVTSCISKQISASRRYFRI